MGDPWMETKMLFFNDFDEGGWDLSLQAREKD
jgi:hypothetical protein